MKARVENMVWRGGRIWVPEGDFPVKRQFDETRYLVYIPGGKLTLLSDTEARIIE